MKNYEAMKFISLLSTSNTSDVLSELQCQENFEIDEIELIRTGSCITKEQEVFLTALFTQNVAVAFTSMNAVEAVGKLAGAIKATWLVYCIGEKTLEFVMNYFPRATIQGTAHNASALGEVIVSENITEKLYFFCGNIRRDDLPNKIASSKIILEEILVYNTTMLNKTIEKTYNGILFYSPSAVESFFSVNKISETVIIFAIGKTTAESTEKFCENKIIIGNVSSKKALLQTSIDYFQNNELK